MKSFIEKSVPINAAKTIIIINILKTFNSPKYLIVIMGLKNMNFINSPKTPKHIPLNIKPTMLDK